MIFRTSDLKGDNDRMDVSTFLLYCNCNVPVTKIRQ